MGKYNKSIKKFKKTAKKMVLYKAPKTLYPKPANPMNELKATLRWAGNYALSTTSSQSTSILTFRINSLYDPDVSTGTG